MKKILTLLAIGFSMFVIDFIWIGLIMNNFYLENLRPVLLLEFKMIPLVLFYVFYALSILFLVVVQAPNMKKAFLNGAGLGFCAYMTFELVNYGILADWPYAIVIIDIVWGTILTAIVSVVGFKVYKSK